MKSALTVVLFLLLTIGVFVDGNEEFVSVTEGDSVTLKSGVTEIQTDDEIEWWFSGSKLASISRDDSGISVRVKLDGSFRDRLQLNNQTGDLKISNIRTTDSGEYKLLISSPRGSSEMIFTVKVVSADVSADEVKSVSVLEGYSVTLHTDLTEIHREDVIRWMFEQQKSPVAELNRKAGIFNIYDGADERFRDRLQLDQAGSLIITDTRTTDSGLYEADISSSRSRHTTHHTQSFNLTVRAYVESVSVVEGDSVTLYTGLTGIQRTEQTLWKFGDRGEIIADLNNPVNKKWNNTHLNPQTGDLIISNIQTDQYGDYKVEINTRTIIFHRKYRIIGSDLHSAVPCSGLPPAAVAGIVVGGVLLGAAVVVMYYHRKISELEKQKERRENESQQSNGYVNMADDHVPLQERRENESSPSNEYEDANELSEAQPRKSAGSGPESFQKRNRTEELYKDMYELRENESSPSNEYEDANERRKNESQQSNGYVNMDELSEAQPRKSAGSGPFLKREGNEENEYDSA